MAAEPGGDAPGVAGEPQLRDRDADGAVGRRRLTRQPRSALPLDEEGKRGLGGGLLDPGQSPAQGVTASLSCAGRHVEAEAPRDLVEPLRPDRPAERRRDRGRGLGDPAPERALRGFGRVDDRDQLEVGAAERHDPVGGAPARVTAALDRRQAVPRLDLAPGCREIGNRDQYVVEVQSDET
jgi:hypothetical protein